MSKQTEMAEALDKAVLAVAEFAAAITRGYWNEPIQRQAERRLREVQRTTARNRAARLRAEKATS